MIQAHYFSPLFREWYAAGLLQKHGLHAWRCFLRASAAHEMSDTLVRPGSVRPVPFVLEIAHVHADYGRNTGRPLREVGCE